MYLFHDSTLNTWRLITEKLPEKPIDVQHIDFTHPTEGLKHVHIGGDPLAYENRLKKYNKAIAALKQNALTVGNPEIITTDEIPGEPGVPYKPGELYFWPGGYVETQETDGVGDNVWTVAILTLPEEKKNTMENIHLKLYNWRTLCGSTEEGIRGSFLIAEVTCQECLKISSSGSVAAPKEEETPRRSP